MSEKKSLTGSIKAELYDKLLNSIDREFAKESIALPPELMLCFTGRGAEVSVSDEKLWEILTNWKDRAVRAINSQSVTWDEFFAVFPEPYGSQLRSELLKLVPKE